MHAPLTLLDDDDDDDDDDDGLLLAVVLTAAQKPCCKSDDAFISPALVRLTRSLPLALPLLLLLTSRRKSRAAHSVHNKSSKAVDARVLP